MITIALKSYEIIVFTYFIFDKNNKIRFFDNNFLLAEVNIYVIFKIFF